MPDALSEVFVAISAPTAIAVVVLGFVGGVLSGFIGSGGAFFMTPGMMNLGVPGVAAVASNITHKFGKALVGARRHSQMGNVDKRLAMYLLATALLGIRLAVWINSLLFAGGSGHGSGKSAGADLYISAVFIGVLTFVGISMFRDALQPSLGTRGPSRRVTDLAGRIRLKPLVRFPISDVELSLWVVLPVGLATGYLAGTIGVGGFVGVPAMIYIFGVPTAVAAGTELYLAIYMGAFGALNYAWAGLVDLRLTCLLFLGSLVGVYIGAYGVRVVSERYIRLSTAAIIMGCVASRMVAVPVYLRHLGWLRMDQGWDAPLNGVSTAMLFLSGIGGATFILYNVGRAYLAHRQIQTTLLVTRPSGAPEEERVHG
jgi:uncharacterized membrane protein YfcA